MRACSKFNVIIVCYYHQYFTFFLSNVNFIFFLLGINVIQPTFDILLPVGISFYTFQALSYTIDVYRGDIYAEKNFFKYALFVSFFPQLVAGPIERSKNLLVQINEYHDFNYERVKSGLLIMLWGYFQKVVVADRAAIIVNSVYGNYTDYSGLQILFATAIFTFQIFCDFSGYSSIAIGAAKVMGFCLMENFRQPYFANSIQDFWRRWHISLSTWFRDYLYIPLGGSRCTKTKKYRNIMITFLVSGLWHGASWNYVIWGGLHGAYQVIGDATLPYKRKLYEHLHIKEDNPIWQAGKIMVTFCLVCFAWIFFRAASATDAFNMIKFMVFNFQFHTLLNFSFLHMANGFLNVAIVCVMIVIILILNYVQTKPAYSFQTQLNKRPLWVRWAVYYFIVFFILLFGQYGESQFIYFQF